MRHGGCVLAPLLGIAHHLERLVHEFRLDLEQLALGFQLEFEVLLEQVALEVVPQPGGRRA